MKVTPVAAVVAAALVLVSCTSSKGSAGSSGSHPAGNSSTAPPSPPKPTAPIRLRSDDPCSLLTTKQAGALVGAPKIYTKAVAYDVQLALTNLDALHKTKDSAGYKGHAKTCAYSSSANTTDPTASGVSITLVIDTGPKSSYTLLGYGHSAQNDLSNRIGVPSERNPVNNFIAAALTDKAWMILVAKTTGGESDPELSIALAKLILANLR